MRHLLWLLVLAGGCGRIGMDPIAATDGRSDDARPDVALADSTPPACAVDGAACDDLNICTNTSTCMAGVCASVEPMTCTVAQSEPEYSTTQGARGWFYGFWEISTDPNATYQPATDFQELAQFAGDVWRPPNWAAEPDPNFTWAYLMRWGGHPGSYPEVRAPIRRWVSDVSGRANATVFMARSDSGGDGTRAILVADGVMVFTRDLAGTDTVGFTEIVPIDVTLGSTVDLILHPIGDDGTDTTTMWMNIDSR